MRSVVATIAAAVTAAVLLVQLNVACSKRSAPLEVTSTPTPPPRAAVASPDATCQNCKPPGGSGGGGGSSSGSGGGKPSNKTTWCEQNGGLAGLTPANSFSLHVISLHHGVTTGDVPVNSDLDSAASFFGADMAGGDPSGLVAFPAAPAGCGLGALCGSAGDQGYNSFASDRFISFVNSGTGPKWSARDAHPYPDVFGQGNTAVATASNWVVELTVNELYPGNLQGSEAKYFASYQLRHTPSGKRIVVIAATLEYDNPALKAAEASYLLAYATRTKDQYPTFIAADLNFDANTGVAAVQPAAAMLLKAATWFSHDQPCQNDAPYSTFTNPGCASGAPDAEPGSKCQLIHLLLVTGAASWHVVPRGLRLDPSAPISPPAVLAPTAGWVGLPGIGHPMLEVEFAWQ